jgi:hypothetical protein
MFSARLGAFIKEQQEQQDELSYLRQQQQTCGMGQGRRATTTFVPFTSTTPRAVETASFLPCPPNVTQQWSALGILDTGGFSCQPSAVICIY